MNTEYGTPNFCGGEDFLYLILVPMKKGEEKKNLGGDAYLGMLSTAGVGDISRC
jgi:hypothetical protein